MGPFVILLYLRNSDDYGKHRKKSFNHENIMLSIKCVCLSDTTGSFLMFFYSTEAETFCSKVEFVKIIALILLLIHGQGGFYFWNADK